MANDEKGNKAHNNLDAVPAGYECSSCYDVRRRGRFKSPTLAVLIAERAKHSEMGEEFWKFRPEPVNQGKKFRPKACDQVGVGIVVEIVQTNVGKFEDTWDEGAFIPLADLFCLREHAARLPQPLEKLTPDVRVRFATEVLNLAVVRMKRAFTASRK